MEIGQHISQRYNDELEGIRNKVMVMAGLVEKQTSGSIKSLLERDGDLANTVASSDDAINQMEVEIDEECTRVIALRQPTAGDLRLVIAVVKVITDLERIGDEAAKIAHYAQKLAKKGAVTGMHAELTHLSQLIMGMLQDSLDAFARLDADKAISILSQDIQLHKEFNVISRLSVTYMMEDPRNIKQALRVNWCARSLERIGAHSQNICEYVIYLVNGKDIRHSNLEHVRHKYFPDNDNDNDNEYDYCYDKE